jgi:hypothetical protein
MGEAGARRQGLRGSAALSTRPSTPGDEVEREGHHEDEEIGQKPAAAEGWHRRDDNAVATGYWSPLA